MSLMRVDQEEYAKSIDDLMDEVNSQFSGEFGDPAVVKMLGTSERWPDDKIIRTGSLSLDIDMGIGGWPRGRIVEIAGYESSGKTSLALHAVRNAQMVGLPVIYIDAENALEPNYMKKIGINLEHLMVNQPEHLEGAINMMDKTMHKVGLFVVDSIAFLKAKETTEAEADEETSRAPEARKWARELPKIAKKARQHGTTVIMINQLRKSQNMYEPATSPGGSALKYAHSVKVNLNGRKEKFKDGSGISYHESKYDIAKNKVASPSKRGSFYLTPGGPVDWAEDILLNAIKYGFVLEDEKIEDDVKNPISRKNWFGYILRPGDLEVMQEDNPELSSEVECVSVYRFTEFLEKMRGYPSLLERLEDQILDFALSGEEPESDSDSEQEEDGDNE